MNATFLDNILAHKKKVISEKKDFFDRLRKSLCAAEHGNYNVFRRMISRPGQINLIAEIKKASPSKGIIREDFDIVKIAQIYQDHQAAAISVLTEDKYFLGKPEYVKKVADQVNLPVLTKDFIIDEGQIYEAYYNGARAVLLIVTLLSDDCLSKLMATATFLGIDCLVEVHDEEDLQRALKADAQIIGVNHRNLKTFEVDIQLSGKLVPLIPKDKVIVAESGIQTHADIQALENLGVHAVLIGETFMREKDIGKKIQDVMKRSHHDQG